MHVIVTIIFCKTTSEVPQKTRENGLTQGKKPFRQGGEMRRRLFAAHRFLWTLQPPRRLTNEGWIKCIEIWHWCFLKKDLWIEAKSSEYELGSFAETFIENELFMELLIAIVYKTLNRRGERSILGMG